MKQSIEQLEEQIDGNIARHRGIAPDTPQATRSSKQNLNTQDSDEDEISKPLRPPYGNMVILKQGFPHLSLGPDYLCFVPAFLAFSVASYFVLVLVFSSSQNATFRIVTILICIGQPLAYLLTALGNPGVVLYNSQSSQNVRECTKCHLVVPRHARHCNDCNVCVEHYDHHCPWTSKCIGGGNLFKFYVFLGMTPVYMIYMTVAFVVCMSSNIAKVQHLQKLL